MSSASPPPGAPPPQPTPPPGDGGGTQEPDAEEELDEGKTAPFGWLSLVMIVALAVGTWFLIQKLTEDSKLQDCVQSGRRNCAPIESPGK